MNIIANEITSVLFFNNVDVAYVISTEFLMVCNSFLRSDNRYLLEMLEEAQFSSRFGNVF